MSAEDAQRPKDGRCTLNGYLNNFVVCMEMLDAAVRTSTKDDSPPPGLAAEVAKGKAIVYYTESPRDRALRAYKSEGTASLASWFSPSLYEARAAHALAPIADALLRCRRSIDELERIVERATGVYDPDFIVARDAAFMTFYELEALRPLVLPEDDSEDKPVETATSHPGSLTVALSPSHQRAWETHQRALEANPALASAKDREIFDWIVENDRQSDYTPHHFENWNRYLREARRAFGRSKYNRAKPAGGRSIVRRDEL